MPEQIIEFVLEEALIIIPALWIIGYFLKHTPSVRDWIIPWVLLAVGIGTTLALLGTTVANGVQGVLVTGVAVLAHQLLKQTKERS